MGGPKNLGVDTGHLSRPRRPFRGPLAAILDFAGVAGVAGVAGGAALQAVRRCRRCGVAGGERVPPAPLGWYFVLWAILSFLTKFLLLLEFELFHQEL